MVKLDTKDEDFRALSADSLKGFHVVCMTMEGPSRDELEALNAKCREAGAKLLVADAFGPFAFSFADLQEHDFVEETVPIPPAPGPSTSREEPSPKRRRVEDPAAAEEGESKMVKRSMRFCPISEALDFDLSTASRRQLKRISPVFFLMQALLRTRQEGGPEVEAAWKAYAAERKVDDGLVTLEQLK